MFLAITEAGTIVRSTDATNWSRPDADFRFFPRWGVRDVLHRSGRDYFVGEFEGVWISEDGSNFVEVMSMDVSGRGIAYGNDCFVTVIGDSTCVSPDGTNWTRTVHPEAPDFTTVAFGNRRFVAMGNGGWFATSTNGADWAFSSLGLTDVARVIWDGREFVAVISAPFLGGAAQFILSSADGENWNYHSLPVANATLSDATFADGRLYLVGGSGTVLESGLQPAPRLDIRLAAGPIVQVQISGEPGSSYRLEGREAMTNTGTWSPLTNITLSGSSAVWLDSTWTNAASRFYRAVLLP
jgi:photosystem II stability/assembly factor-like uncharacterized protein